MGDSDEEYDRRRRDKFAKERGSSNGASGRRDYDRGPPSYRGGGDYRARPRDPPSQAPPAKRRRDWAEDTYDPQPRSAPEAGAQAPSAPTLMTFKQWLATQDDSISDDDAIAKYQEYKTDFKRQQLHNFFITHKEEEWFKLKYDPVESVKAREEALKKVRRRQEVFEELLEAGQVDSASLEANNEHNIVRLLDALVVKLEGGTDEDVQGLGPILPIPPPPVPAAQRKAKAKASAPPKAAKKPKPAPPKPKEPEAKADEGEKEEGEEKTEEKENGNGAAKEAGEGEDGALSDSDNSQDGKNGSPKESPVPSPDAPAEEAAKKEPLPEPTTQLHKTASIFLRNISPEIRKAEVEELCTRYQGFLRVGLAEPLPDRAFFRRGWVSFKRNVNIKDIAWNMGSVTLRDCDLGPIVNRDLTRRVRTVNGLTAHKALAQKDLGFAAKLVQAADKRAGLYQPPPKDAQAEPEAQEGDDAPAPEAPSRPMDSGNPLLEGITEFLIEEASAEEEELLGEEALADKAKAQTFARDAQMLKVLDRLVLYLRLVHSIDYYNAGEYPHEDEMPNRCGLVHVRGPPPADGLVPPNFPTDFAKTFEGKLQPLLALNARLSDDEAQRLGKKDPDKEVEAFITANTQELARDKWLCPLSGKKFKGPEFIRKHLENKHGEKLEEVKVEVHYFNNYLYDPKRMGANEPPKPPATPSSDRGHDRPSYGQPPAQSHGDDRRSGGYGGGGGGGGYDSRPPSLVHSDFRGPPGFGPGGGGGGGGGYGGGGGGFGRPPPRAYAGTYGPPGGRGFGGPPRGGYGGPGGPGGFGGPPPRRDPREPLSYKDLDAPEDNF